MTFETPRSAHSVKKYVVDITRALANPAQNFINPSTIRDINSLRQDFLGSLTELGYITDRAALNVNSDNEHLLKGILTGAFYPRVAMIRPPDARFEKIQAGALVKEHEAKEVKFYDESGRVFIVCPSTSTLINADSARPAPGIHPLQRTQSQTWLLDLFPQGRNEQNLPL